MIYDEITLVKLNIICKQYIVKKNLSLFQVELAYYSFEDFIPESANGVNALEHLNEIFFERYSPIFGFLKPEPNYNPVLKYFKTLVRPKDFESLEFGLKGGFFASPEGRLFLQTLKLPEHQFIATPYLYKRQPQEHWFVYVYETLEALVNFQETDFIYFEGKNIKQEKLHFESFEHFQEERNKLTEWNINTQTNKPKSYRYKKLCFNKQILDFDLIHIARILSTEYTTKFFVSPDFVEKYQQSGLTGLQFTPYNEHLVKE